MGGHDPRRAVAGLHLHHSARGRGCVMENALIDWMYDTRLSWFITNYGWLWPINETLHFCGLTMLAGTVGLFDLRLLGFAKGIAPSTLHATLKWGVAGFAVSAITGVQFLFGAPE